MHHHGFFGLDVHAHLRGALLAAYFGLSARLGILGQSVGVRVDPRVLGRVAARRRARARMLAHPREIAASPAADCRRRAERKTFGQLRRFGFQTGARISKEVVQHGMSAPLPHVRHGIGLPLGARAKLIDGEPPVLRLTGDGRDQGVGSGGLMPRGSLLRHPRKPLRAPWACRSAPIVAGAVSVRQWVTGSAPGLPATKRARSRSRSPPTARRLELADRSARRPIVARQWRRRGRAPSATRRALPPAAHAPSPCSDPTRAATFALSIGEPGFRRAGQHRRLRPCASITSRTTP